jgi:YafQ family addiction module toxin component
MTYSLIVSDTCKKDIGKLCRKNPILEHALKSKIREILENPQHYKPLKYDLAGERRVHIMKSFVLKFQVEEKIKTVTFLFFGHHDEAYGLG